MGGTQSSAIGLPYKPVNARARQNLEALQSIFTEFENIFCQRYKERLLIILNDPDVFKYFSQNTYKNQITKMKKHEPVMKKAISKITLNEEEQIKIMKVLDTFLTVIIGNSTTDGKIDLKIVRQELIDIVNSFCKNKITQRSPQGSPQTSPQTSPQGSGQMGQQMAQRKMFKPPMKSSMKGKSNFGAMSNTTIYIIIAVIAVILIVVGIYMFKKKKKPSVFGKRSRR